MIELFALHLNYEFLKDKYQLLLNNVHQEKLIRIKRFLHFEDAMRTLMGDIMLKLILRNDFNIDAENIRFYKNVYGKPYLKNEANIYFNVSHSGDWVVCAVGNKEVGVDIEKIQDIDLEVGKIFMVDSEYETLMNQRTKQSKVEYFYEIWTLKESYTKAEGKGLSIPMNSFEISFKNKQPYLLRGNKQLWKLKQYVFDTEYKLATCSQGEILNEIKYYNCEDLFVKAMQLNTG